jgi:hypothetical protein
MRAVEAGVSDYSALNDIAASGESDRCLFALGFGSCHFVLRGGLLKSVVQMLQQAVDVAN